ncbi:hypothetical protein [Yoonia sp. SS1-5]|uniref:Uncharacterized protein n=1 Tax=Yoonia rhodophyticola TaxID=3137370 RepID=A0AAN0ML73_9RHOB
MTIKHNLTALLFTFGVIGLPHAGSAQASHLEDRPRTQARTYTAPVKILDNHPICNGPGHVAFTAAIDGDNLDLRISGEDWDGYVEQSSLRGEAREGEACIIGYERVPFYPETENICDAETYNPDASHQVNTHDAPQCYITTRRGLERITTEVACGADESPNSLNRLVRDAEIRLDVAATASICQSLTGIGILDSVWTATLAIGGQTAVFEGAFGVDTETNSNQHGVPDIRLHFRRGGYNLKPISAELAAGPQHLDPMRSGDLSLVVNVEAAPIPGTDALPVTLRARRGFPLVISSDGTFSDR